MRILIISLAVMVCLSGLAHARGHWELGIHFSYWSVNVASTYIEQLIEGNIAAEVERYDPSKGALDFTSRGSNYGLEVRFFPGGKEGSFSIGLSYEKNFFNGDVQGDYQDDLGGGLDRGSHRRWLVQAPRERGGGGLLATGPREGAAHPHGQAG